MALAYKVRLLNEGDLGQMYQTFIEAFSKYSVNMTMSRSAFRSRMLEKLRLQFNVSPGVFIGDKLVAFIFHVVNDFEGYKTAYNGGTGVIPGYWGNGFTQKMYEFIKPVLKKYNVERSVLEVIKTNQQAINAYEKAGFHITRHYKCYKLTGQLVPKQFPSDLSISKSLNVDIENFKQCQSLQASMLDSNEHLFQSLKNEIVLEARLSSVLVGYIVFQAPLGRVSQIAVDPRYRRRGIGTTLMRSAYETSSSKKLTVINIDEKEVTFCNFLSDIGFVNQVDQYEMQCLLN